MKWDPGGTLRSSYIYEKIVSSVQVGTTQVSNDQAEYVSRTEFDTHANMAVIGKHAYILAKSGKTVDVSPFTPNYKPMSAPIVDAALQYDDPFTGKQYILVVRNAIHVPLMSNNLLPPFMLREAGITVYDTPKIQVDDPSEEDHAIIFKEKGFKIPLSLWGTFLFFPTSKPSQATLQEPPDVYVLTPSTWNPHSDAYAINEESMLDWEGYLRPLKDRDCRFILNETPGNEALVSLLHIDENKQIAIDAAIVSDDDEPVSTPMMAHGDGTIYDRIEARGEISNFMMNIGATDTWNGSYLIETVEEDSDDETSEASVDDDIMISDAPEGTFDEELNDLDDEYDLDELMAAATTADVPKGINAKHLSKVWRISYDDAKRTLENTTQRSVQTQDRTLSRNYGTNDRMLRYKRIKDYFYMDTSFFATKKGGRSSRGHTCCQLFVTDKGFVYVIPMQRKLDVPYALKQFAKEIGAPDAIVADMSGEQMSAEVKRFCNDIGTTLRAPEEGTPWANKAELYIGLMKEAVRKDMREADSPLPLWDFCIERRARVHNLTAKDRFALHGTTPHTLTTGDEGNILNLCQYGWYEWCYF